MFDPPQSCTLMLFLKLNEYLPELKPFLVCLSYWPDNIDMGDGNIIKGSDISLNDGVIKILRQEFQQVDKNDQTPSVT